MKFITTVAMLIALAMASSTAFAKDLVVFSAAAIKSALVPVW